MPTPRQFDDVATTVIRVRVTEAQRRDLERVANENRTTVSGVIRESVDEYVGDYRDRRLFVKRGTAAGS